MENIPKTPSLFLLNVQISFLATTLQEMQYEKYSHSICTALSILLTYRWLLPIHGRLWSPPRLLPRMQQQLEGSFCALLQVFSVKYLPHCTKDWQLSHVQLARDKWSPEWMGWTVKSWKPQDTELYLPANSWDNFLSHLHSLLERGN